jgi:hypothetical protein
VVIDDDVATHFESGDRSMVMATLAADGTPRASRAWGFKFEAGGERFRALVAADDAVAVANLRATGVIALTAASVPTLAALQVKGRVVGVEQADDADRERFARYKDMFFEAVHVSDATNDVAAIARMAPRDVVAVVATADAVFDQTPGPTAGSRLGPDDA